MTNQTQNPLCYPPLILERFQNLKETEQMDLCCFFLNPNGKLGFDADDFILALLKETFFELARAFGLVLLANSKNKSASRAAILRLTVKKGVYSVVYDAPLLKQNPANKKLFLDLNKQLRIASKKFNDMMNAYALCLDEANWKSLELSFTWHEQGGFKYDNFVRQANTLETLNEQKYQVQDALKNGLIEDVIRRLEDGKEKGYLDGLEDGCLIAVSLVTTEDFKVVDIMYQALPSFAFTELEDRD